jgi:uncharacterized protein
MTKRTVQLRCPICKNPVMSSDPEFPFCSERCRTVDLGKWASGQYVISSPLPDTDDNFEPSSEVDSSDDE